MATYHQQGQQVAGPQYNADLITIHMQAMPHSLAPEVLAAAEQQLAALPLDTIPGPTPLPEGSRMPFRPNPLFVGREAELRQLAQVLQGNGIAAIGQIAAATGVGGFGKTQLAVEFAHRYGSYFTGGVFWLNCATPEAILHEVAACGGAGGLQLHPEFHALPLEEQVRGVQRAWQSPLPRLLVFDSCENQGLIAQWRPTSGGCRVLLTSRRASWEASLGLTTLALDVLPRLDSLALLRRFRPDLAPSDPDLDMIAAELGDLPLALHLAGSFLARYCHAIAPATYLAQLRQPNLLAHASLQGRMLTQDLSPTQHGQHVKRTFALSYDRLDPSDLTDAHALALLARAAYFAPGQPIPRDLLLATVTGAENASDAALRAEDALGRLRDLGLLELDMTGAVRLHRLLAAFVRAVAHDAAAQTAVEDALLAAAERLSHVGYSEPMLALRPHIQAVTEAAQPRADGRTAHLATVLGRSLYELGDYSGAESWYARALAIREPMLGPEHPAVATSLNGLAGLYYAQGRYAEAEPLYQRALALREQGLGAEHSDVAQSLNNLATLYCAQGCYAEAEPLYQRALAISEQALGLEHPDVAQNLNNLAELYDDQGRYAEAEPLLQRALAISEQALGPEHPAVATILNNLAGLYDAQGRYAEAEPLHQRALALRERVLGPEHPNVADSLNNLAGFYYDQGRCAEAEPLLQRALALRERVLGSEHPNVAQSLNNLAGLYRAQGCYAEAEPLLQRALALYERVLGPEHPNVAQSLSNLAGLYDDQGRYAEAEPLLQRALAISEQALGPKHPNVAQSLNNLAVLYDAQGRYAEAELMYQQALSISERISGADHPDVAIMLNNLARVYRGQERYAEAEPLYQRALTIREQALGPDHPDVAVTLNHLATLYHAQERYAEAEPLVQRALTIREQRLGLNHPDVVVTLKNYLDLLKAMHREAEAAQMEQRLLAMQAGSPTSSPSTP